jgi:hypothetical protein
LLDTTTNNGRKVYCSEIIPGLLVLLKVRIFYSNTKRRFKRILILSLVIIPVDLSGQSNGSMEEYWQKNTALPAEKIYLHLDRPNYIQGDTIWFKAYSWFGYDQIPDTLSGVLYVDLLNPLGGVELKRKVLIQNGISQGDFNLDKKIMPGRYILRAYTRWMQNLNTGEPFYQPITISLSDQNFQVECNPVIIKQAGNDSLKVTFRFFELSKTGELNNNVNHKMSYSLKVGDQMLQSGNVLAANTREQVVKLGLSPTGEKDSVAIFGLSIQDDLIKFEKQFRILLNDPVDIQFFPEGGKLVNGLVSKVAFKAIGTDGLSRGVTGQIKDDAGGIITSFTSLHKGMGAFMLKPVAGKKYSAYVLFNNRLYIIPLPPALEEGSNMATTIPDGGNSLYLTIRLTPSETDRLKYVAGSAYGKIRFAIPVKTTGDSCLIKIPLNLFPEGVSRLTVLNGDFKPECERLLYINKNQRFKIKVEPDSLSYGTRSKVTLMIKTTGQGGIPVQTDLSLAVADKEQIIKEGGITGICAYKLLSSELQGHIEDADYYFRGDSIIEQDALDLLMLTQGYRKFLPANTNPDGQKFQPEKSFEISGIIKLKGKGARVRNYDYRNIGLTILCRSDGMYLDQSESDSLGRFKFQIPLLNRKSNSLIQATTSKGKPFFGEIVLNETTTLPKFKIPLPEVKKSTVPVVEYVSQIQAVKKTELSITPWQGAMSVTLGEVTVTAKAKNWYRNFETNAEKIADLDSLDPDGNKYQNIYDLLVQEFGAEKYFNPHTQLKTIKLPSYGMEKIWSFSWFPIYVINGKTYFNGGEDFRLSEDGVMFVTLLNNLSVIGVNEIKRLMVLPPGDIASYYADDSLKTAVHQSLVVIETYSENTFRGDPTGIKTFVLEGLDTPRAFYSPRYEGSQRKSPVYDGRATLFWEPSIRTDAGGQARVEFFTSDRKKALEVVVNGIETGNGNPGQGRVLVNSALAK